MEDFRKFFKKMTASTEDNIRQDIRNKAPKLGEYLAINVGKGLEESDKNVVKAFEGLYEKLRYQRDFDLISEADYYRNLENLRDQYFKKGSKEWVKYTLEIFEYQKEQYEEEQKNIAKLLEEEQKNREKLLKEEQKAIEKRIKEDAKALETEKKNITNIYDGITKYANEKLNSVLKKHRSTVEEINSYGSLFNVNTVLMNGKKDTYITLHDIEHDIGVLKRYANVIEEIKTRISALGLGDEEKAGLMTALNGLGITEGLGLAEALMRADDETFSGYAESLQIKKSLAVGISAKRYEEEFETAWTDAYENMKRELGKAGYEIPEGFYTSGSISAEKFGEGFADEFDTQLLAIRMRIDEFNADLGIGNAFFGSGDTYNTTNTSYNIQSQDGSDTVEAIQRMETVKRLSGVN